MSILLEINKLLKENLNDSNRQNLLDALTKIKLKSNNELQSGKYVDNKLPLAKRGQQIFDIFWELGHSDYIEDNFPDMYSQCQEYISQADRYRTTSSSWKGIDLNLTEQKLKDYEAIIQDFIDQIM